VGVTRQQADRWRKGENVRLERLEQVAEAVRALLPEHKEAAPPAWAERLKGEILAGILIAQEPDIPVSPERLNALASALETLREQADSLGDAGP
jgi:mono/diheme cytochrome c family protein